MPALEDLRRSRFLERLGQRDASIWSSDPDEQASIRNRLGWLSVHRAMETRVTELAAFNGWVRENAFRHVVLLGMGGSSLAPEVFQRLLGAAPGHPELIVLDTTDPASVLAVENRISIISTVFIVSSKSGTTIETSSLHRYFAERMRDETGDTGALDNFVAITDPDTPLQHQAQVEGFRYIFLNPPDIGGRYSALSYFGLVPAAAIGADIQRLLDETAALDWEEGVELGARLGELAKAGRDKVTFLPSPGLDAFGAWAEQLLAESTGKRGTGLVPVDEEPPGPPSVYGDDRVFVYLDAGERNDETDSTVQALEAAGHPVVTTSMSHRYQLGREFLRWEIATAAAGAVLGINPFDEPNVSESKDNTRRVLEEYVRATRLPEPLPTVESDNLTLYLDETTAAGIERNSLLDMAAAHLSRARPPQYVAVMAYLQRTEENDRLLATLRQSVRAATQAATTLGYGPRFLHSTGQLHKGGPETGVFLQITADDPTDLDIPGESGYGFSVLKQAQALGDLQSLRSRRRLVARVHLHGDTTAALRRLVDGVEARLGAATLVRGD